MAVSTGRVFEPNHGILKGGMAAICVLLLLRLGTNSLPARLFVVPSGSERRILQGRLQPELVSSRSSGMASKSSRHSFGTSAPLALLAGGASACRRRRVAAGPSSPRLASAGDSEASQPAPQESVSTKDLQGDSKGGGGEGGVKKLIKQFKEDPEFQEDVKTFFTSLTIALMIRGFLVEPRFIPSLSMYPNFDIGDQLTVDKISKRWREYQRRDVVVFNPPPKFNEVVGGDRSGDALIKRIVAVAGDTVEIKNGGTLYLNGEPQDEPFTNEAARYDLGPVQVPEGCVLVLGDNRNQSLDGHVWGFLPLENIIGRATFKFWPPWHVGTITAAPP